MAPDHEFGAVAIAKRLDLRSFFSQAILFICLAFPLCSLSLAQEPSFEKLETWQLLGIGGAELSENDLTLKLTEEAGSKGVILLSPLEYGRHVVVNFQVKPLVFEVICVLFLSASPVHGEKIDPGEQYDGNFNYWRGKQAAVKSYTFAFHTAFHQPNAFVIRNPGPVELDKQTDKVTDQKWYDIQFGRDEGRVWLKVDGEYLLQGEEPTGKGLPGGRIGFRVRGSGDGSASVLYRNVQIREFK